MSSPWVPAPPPRGVVRTITRQVRADTSPRQGGGTDGTPSPEALPWREVVHGDDIPTPEELK
jgi:hypothetical protein